MNLHRFTALFAVGFVLICANAADAGFVSVGLEDTNLFSTESITGGSGATDESPVDPVPGDEFFRNNLAANTSGGMSSPTTGGHSNPVPTSAVAAVVVDAPALLLSWLGPEGRVWLPPPFLSGVFRPPRANS